MPEFACLKPAWPNLIYLSLSDYVQHKHAPDAPEAIAFMHAVDQRLERLLALGACLGIVADHGMNDMAHPSGEPNVVYLGDLLDAAFGAGATRVDLPDHPILSCVTMALWRLCPCPSATEEAFHHRGVELHSADPGVCMAASREEACLRFELPEDREGDIAVVARSGAALGGHASEHDLSQLSGERLRSHGGLAEQVVPFILSHPLKAERFEAGQGNRSATTTSFRSCSTIVEV
jgi:phosphonoacetate hydrolase